MRVSSRPLLCTLTLVAASLLVAAGAAQARMEPMDDSDLAAVTGQAFINLATASNAGIDYTRINLGMKVETQLNMKKLQLGLYPRTGEAAGTADIDIDNFALGSVNDTTGALTPFMINDPFVEMAYSGNKIVGMRVGFAESKGVLSGDIKNLTGSVPVHIEGSASAIYDKADFGQRLLLGIAGVYRTSTMQAEAELVTPAGLADSIRATHTGIKNGDGLNCKSGCLGGFTNALLGVFASNNCSVLGIATCFPLANFQSLPVGNMAIADIANTQTIEGSAKGFFISLQTQAVAWQDMDSGDYKTALAGAYLNLPKFKDANGNLVAPINVDFAQALNGIPRVDTCLGSADRGC
jgi:hypothetical protein